MFFETLGRFASHVAAIDTNNDRYTYEQLQEESDRFATHLAAGRKNLVLIMGRNNIEPLIGYLGTLRSGNTALLLASDIDAGLFANLVNLYRPDYIWEPSKDSRTDYTYKGYSLTHVPVTRAAEIHPSLSLLLSTSGSTGSPKLVRLTAANVDANASSIVEYLNITASERPITALPMHYSFGLSIINSHLRVGATLLLTNESIVTRGFWEFFKAQQATSLSGVPYTYEMLRRLNFFSMELPSLKTMTQAGGKLTPKFAQEFAEYSHRKGIEFFVMYGQTEATARISYLPPKDNLAKYHSIGISIPGGVLSIFNERGERIVTPDVDGELVYRGPNVMMGYAEQEADLARGDELHGELKTGDVARFDQEGFFYITGRMKRFIKIFGNRVNLDEIEHHLKSLGYTSVCGGADDLLCVATTDRGKADEIKTHILQTYGFHHGAVKAIEVSEILKNSSGKIQYEKIFEGLLA